MTKKACRNGKWIKTNEYYERDIDLSEVGLRGRLKPADFGWEEHDVPDSEKEGFTETINVKFILKHFQSLHAQLILLLVCFLICLVV